MPVFDPVSRLDDILAAIEDIEGFTAGKSFDDYMAEPMMRRAVERSVEIVSEASRHLLDDLKSLHPQIPWRSIGGVGNVLRHAYKVVDDAEMWDVIARDLAPLKAAIERMLDAMQSKGTT